jgi:hypothetical protein
VDALPEEHQLVRVGRVRTSRGPQPAGVFASPRNSLSDTVWSGVDRRLKSGAGVPAFSGELGSTFEV